MSKEKYVSVSFGYAEGVIDRVGKAYEIVKENGGYTVNIDVQMKGRMNTVSTCLRNAVDDIYFKMEKA